MHVQTEELMAIFAEHIVTHNQELDATIIELQNMRIKGTYLVWITILGAILLLIGIGIGLTRTITRPISHLIQIFPPAHRLLQLKLFFYQQ